MPTIDTKSITTTSSSFSPLEDSNSLVEERQSRSPNTTTFGNLKERLARALSTSKSPVSREGPSLSKTGDNASDVVSLEDEKSLKASKMSDRSRSRGREFVSTGRGGAGNFVRPESETRGRVDRQVDGDERGRELSPQNAGERITHTGRGGAGNIRSPSRDPEAAVREIREERDAIAQAQSGAEKPTFSTGRGGVGNIHHSPSPARSGDSRDRSTSRTRFVSSGRGGAGNIHHPGKATPNELERLDEDERVRASEGHESTGPHSTGRGGLANVTDLPDTDKHHPTSEVPTEEGVHSSGKGGYGNIVHGQHHEGDEHQHTGKLGGIWDRVTGHHKK